MPKLKTNKAVKKRMWLTKKGRVKRGYTGKRHILTKKSRKRKRVMRQGTLVDKTFEKSMKRMLPYG